MQKEADIKREEEKKYNFENGNFGAMHDNNDNRTKKNVSSILNFFQFVLKCDMVLDRVSNDIENEEWRQKI
jgi:hypothetical protein